MKKHSSKARIKREDFITQWNVHQKETEYNPLEDPHANYYFITKAAKQRLRDLKSEMKRANYKSPRTKEYIQQLNFKIKFEFPKVKLPLINPQAEEPSLRKSDRKLSEQFHLKMMTERGQQHEHYKSSLSKLATKKEQLEQQKTDKVQTNREQMRKAKSKKKLKSMRVSKQQNKVNHDDFLLFLEKKKGQLQLCDKSKD